MVDCNDYQDRRILITGGGAGIGATTARALAKEGARIAILDRDGAAAERTAGSPCITIRTGMQTSRPSFENWPRRRWRGSPPPISS